ncbi:hypothetical protein ACFE04_023022 [Oxalis oulophora]
MLMIRKLNLLKTLTTTTTHHHHLHSTTTGTTTNSTPTTPVVNQDHLLKACTILYQQQHSPTPRLHSNLSSLNPHITHEFFLQVCNKFPLSWRPVYLFFLYTQSLCDFTHTSTSYNKMIDCIGKAKNIDLFWTMVNEMGKLGFVNDKTFRIGLKTLASARELKKCVDFFHVMNGFGYDYSVDRLNKVVETLCEGKLVEEANYVVTKLKGSILPNGVTYKLLIKGFCDKGDMVKASKIWNLMVDEGCEVDIDAYEKMMETFFKVNRHDEALKIFQMMRVKMEDRMELSTYRLVIDWMSKQGKVEVARMMFDEMLHRNIRPDNRTYAALIYGNLARGRISEAYRIFENVENPDIFVYHGLIKGLLKLKRAREATQVFREMIKRGCEPEMHTYVMLLQGHLGKRGRKGRDPLVNFDTIFVGGLVKAGKSLEATKYVERSMNKGVEVPRFDYNKFLHYYSSEEGAKMFEDTSKKLREVGLFDLADVMERYGQKMATRDRRRDRAVEQS